MKKGTVTRLCGLILLLVMAAVCLPKAAQAATQVNNEQTVTLRPGVNYTFTLPLDTETLFTGTPGLMIMYGKSKGSSDYSLTLDSELGYAEGPHTKGTYYFKIMSGDGEVTITWEEGNKDIGSATEFSLNQGKSRKFDQEGPYRYYLLNVTDPSAKYTFKTDNTVVHMDIFEGKRTNYASAEAAYRIEQEQSKTLVLKKGYYTIAGISHSKPVQFTVTRENWVGITKITPSNGGKIVGISGEKFEYVVNYEPKNADSRISTEGIKYIFSDDRVTWKSQKDGKAVFEIDYTQNAEEKYYIAIYSLQIKSQG